MEITGRLDSGAALLRLKLQEQTRQISTGVKAEAPGDLGVALPRVLDLRAEQARRDAYDATIGRTLERTEAAQQALQRLGAIAREYGSDVAMKLDANDPTALPLFASRARAALVEVGRLLNTTAGGEYVFGGSDFAHPPVPDPDGIPTGGMASQIAAAIGGLTTGNAAAVAATTAAAASDDAAGVSPYSGFLQSGGAGLVEPRRSVPANDGLQVSFGLFANRNAAATSQGETVGSWARDLMRGLASIAALTPQLTATKADFEALSITIRNGLNSAADALADEAGALGITEKRLEDTRTRNTTLRDALTGQLGNIQDADLASTLTRMQDTRTVLEASYSAMSQLGRLTLTSFL